MIVFSFCRYESPEIALNCGIMLRECIRHEPLAKIILWSEQFYDFFRYVEMSTFDIASDAFATFKVTKTIEFQIYVQVRLTGVLFFAKLSVPSKSTHDCPLVGKHVFYMCVCDSGMCSRVTALIGWKS